MKEHFPAPAERPKSEAGPEQRVGKTLEASQEALHRADEALGKAKPEHRLAATRVGNLRGAVDTLRARLLRAGAAIGLVGALGGGALHEVRMQPASAHEGPRTEQVPEEAEATETAPEAAKPDPYRSQEILAQRFIEAVTQKLQEARPETTGTAAQNEEDELIKNDPEAAVKQEFEKDKENMYPVFLKMAKAYPGASPEQQQKMRAKYAEWRHSLQFEASYNTSELESDMDQGNAEAQEKHTQASEGAQQALTSLDEAIGPEALATALKQEDEIEAPKRAAKYTGDPFSPNYVPAP